MESDWRWNREEYGLGGRLLNQIGGDFELQYLARLNPPVAIAGVGIATLIGTRPAVGGFRRYYLYKEVPVGTSAYAEQITTNVVVGNQRFPFAAFPVDPDS